MAEHNASITVNAPVSQVYQLFTHFNDYPKFMSHIKEVTYIDNDRSHWVADVVGHHEWDAVNSDWVENQQIGWKSTDGLENAGTVTFTPLGDNQTTINVSISYDPPAGVLGDLGEALGVGKKFEKSLSDDLVHFAKLVDAAPAGALDPNSSSYIFHSESAAAKGQTTDAQNASDPNSASGRPIAAEYVGNSADSADDTIGDDAVSTGAFGTSSAAGDRTPANSI